MGCLFDFPFYQGVPAESEFGKHRSKGILIINIDVLA